MVEATQIVYKYKELAALLVKDQGIHNGYWVIYAKFGIQALNLGQTENDLLPAAIVPLVEIGIQKVDKETSLSVDAAKVNPLKASRVPRKRKK